MNLHGIARDVDRDLGAVQLRHRRFLLVGTADLFEPRSPVIGLPRQFRLRRHVGDLELESLECTDRLAECDAFLGVFDALVNTSLSEAYRKGRDRDTSV